VAVGVWREELEIAGIHNCVPFYEGWLYIKRWKDTCRSGDVLSIRLCVSVVLNDSNLHSRSASVILVLHSQQLLIYLLDGILALESVR
jgi:hypothetical protein